MQPLAPQLPGSIAVSSAGTPWSGFPLEVHSLPARGESPPYAYPHSTAFLYTSGETTARISPVGQSAKQVKRCKGTLTLRRKGWAVAAFQWNGERELELLAVQLCPAALEALGVQRVADDLPSLSEDGFVDPHFAALMLAMRTEVQQGCRSGALYGESLSLYLALHATSRYSVPRRTPLSSNASVLAPWQLIRVLDYIRTNIEKELRLFELAALFDLSPHHFSLLFRNSVGTSPHQFVIRERLRAARMLIREGRESIGEIAVRLGFSSHSHFCETFRRHMGHAPGKLR
jgi:AraC family transcriptional regulator